MNVMIKYKLNKNYWSKNLQSFFTLFLYKNMLEYIILNKRRVK